MICNELLKQRKLPPVWDETDTDWETRRSEIKELLQREVYGYLPEQPEELSFQELPPERFYERVCAGKAPLQKIQIRGKVNGNAFSFPMFSLVPHGGKHLPFFVLLNFRPSIDRYFPIPIEEIIDNGFALFILNYQDAAPDDSDFGTGLGGPILNGRKRASCEPGKIAMWAWAASRVMDYCQTLDCLDLSRGAVIGHSRLGKTALLAGMMDERFRFVISNNSGCSGAALARGKKGEDIESICDLIGYWFAPNYQKYRQKEETLPLDQHFLVAAIAPRYVYVASASEDFSADPVSEYLSCCAADEVYEKLGLKGFVHPDTLPEAGDVFHEGHIGYHMRRGVHYLSREDWNHYCRFIINHG